MFILYYRSGAVEQLRVHVRNLGMLGVDGATNSKGRVELYERGYGKDAAGIAKEAISYGGSRFYPAVNFVLTVKQPATTTSMSCLSTPLDVCRTTR